VRNRSPVLKRRLIMLGLAVALWPVAGVSAEEPGIEGITGTCYSASFDREHGPMKEITAEVEPSDQIDASEPYNLSLAFTEWDVPNEVFDTVAGCTTSGGVLHCSIDCDGGHATVALGADGRLDLQTAYLRYGSTGDENLLAVSDADGGSLTGLYALQPDPGRKDCRPTADHVFAVLEPGDISPRVQQAETMLNRIGQFLEFPDTVFDEATEAAVRGFQNQYGLAPSGRIDERTALALVRASASLGGC
jgi:hypothetical protein